jgi:protein TonB
MGGLGTGPAPAVRVEAPKGPARVSSGVVSGLKISGANPTYPPIAKAAHVSGAVVLHAIISKTGTIEHLTAISGPEMLKGAALDAVRTWRYKPYILNNEPTEVETTITVNFNFGG